MTKLTLLEIYIIIGNVSRALIFRVTGKPGDTTDLREWMRTFCSVSANMSSRAELSGPRVVSSSLHIGKKVTFRYQYRTR
jgi:hypothetical protein